MSFDIGAKFNVIYDAFLNNDDATEASVSSIKMILDLWSTECFFTLFLPANMNGSVRIELISIISVYFQYMRVVFTILMSK